MPSVDSHFPVTQSPERSKRPVVSWEGSCRDAAFTERVDTPTPREEWTRDQLRPASGGFRSQAWHQVEQGSMLISFPSSLGCHMETQSHAS